MTEIKKESKLDKDEKYSVGTASPSTLSGIAGNGSIRVKIKTIPVDDDYVDIYASFTLAEPKTPPPQKKHVTLILDKSGSMAPNDAYKKLKEGAIQIIRGLNEDTLVTVIMFDEGTKVIAERAKPSERASIISSIKKDKIGGGSNFIKATQHIDPKICRADEDTRFLFFTDGVHNSKKMIDVTGYWGQILKAEVREEFPVDDAVNEAKQRFRDSGIPYPSVYTIGFNEPIPYVLKRLSTNNDFFYASSVKELKKELNTFLINCNKTVAAVTCNFAVKTTPDQKPFYITPPYEKEIKADHPCQVRRRVPRKYFESGYFTFTINGKRYSVNGSKLLEKKPKEKQNNTQEKLAALWARCEQIPSISAVQEQVAAWMKVLEEAKNLEKSNGHNEEITSLITTVTLAIKSVGRDGRHKLQIQALLANREDKGRSENNALLLAEKKDGLADYGIQWDAKEGTLTYGNKPYVLINRTINLVDLIKHEPPKSAVWMDGVGFSQPFLILNPEDLKRKKTTFIKDHKEYQNDDTGFYIDAIQQVREAFPKSKVDEQVMCDIVFHNLADYLGQEGSCREEAAYLGYLIAEHFSKQDGNTKEVNLVRFTADNLKAHAFVRIIDKETGKTLIVDPTNNSPSLRDQGPTVVDLSNHEELAAAIKFYETEDRNLPGILRELCPQAHDSLTKLLFTPPELTLEQQEIAAQQGWLDPFTGKLMSEPVAFTDGINSFFCDLQSFKKSGAINPFTKKPYQSDELGRPRHLHQVTYAIVQQLKEWFPCPEKEKSSSKKESKGEVADPKIALIREEPCKIEELDNQTRSSFSFFVPEGWQKQWNKQRCYASATLVSAGSLVFCLAMGYVGMSIYEHSKGTQTLISDFIHKNPEAFATSCVALFALLAIISLIASYKYEQAEKITAAAEEMPITMQIN